LFLSESVKISGDMEQKANVRADSRAAQETVANPMSRLRRFAYLGLAEKVLLLRALFWVSAVRLGLCLLPFPILQRITRRESRKSNGIHSAVQYAWAVRAVSRYVPGATCLTQALAAQALLTQSGHDSQIEIGVMKDEQRRFRAHAWVLCGEQIVIGGAEVDDYVPLAAWKTRAVRIEKT
jgi:hypothetical protein